MQKKQPEREIVQKLLACIAAGAPIESFWQISTRREMWDALSRK